MNTKESFKLYADKHNKHLPSHYAACTFHVKTTPRFVHENPLFQFCNFTRNVSINSPEFSAQLSLHP